MPFQNPTYAGDAEHTIDCTGDAVVGDQVAFERATFTGSFRNAKFAGFELVVGTIIADSYGAEKQQHTFTIRLKNDSTIKIKGRNLYANKLMRAPWRDESFRELNRADKHARGDDARAKRAQRINESGHERF